MLENNKSKHRQDPTADDVKQRMIANNADTFMRKMMENRKNILQRDPLADELKQRMIENNHNDHHLLNEKTLLRDYRNDKQQIRKNNKPIKKPSITRRRNYNNPHRRDINIEKDKRQLQITNENNLRQNDNVQNNKISTHRDNVNQTMFRINQKIQPSPNLDKVKRKHKKRSKTTMSMDKKHKNKNGKAKKRRNNKNRNPIAQNKEMRKKKKDKAKKRLNKLKAKNIRQENLNQQTMKIRDNNLRKTHLDDSDLQGTIGNNNSSLRRDPSTDKQKQQTDKQKQKTDKQKQQTVDKSNNLKKRLLKKFKKNLRRNLNDDNLKRQMVDGKKDLIRHAVSNDNSTTIRPTIQLVIARQRKLTSTIPITDINSTISVKP